MSAPITTEELDTELAKLNPLREALATCEESGFPGSGAVLIPRDCALRLVDELTEAKRELAALKAIAADGLKNMDNPDYTGPVVAELANALRSIRGSATSEATPPTVNPDNFDLRTWNPGNHNPPDGVL